MREVLAEIAAMATDEIQAREWCLVDGQHRFVTKPITVDQAAARFHPRDYPEAAEAFRRLKAIADIAKAEIFGGTSGNRGE